MTFFIEQQMEAEWSPTSEFIRGTNIAWLMQHAGVDSYAALHAWSVHDRAAFWGAAIERVGIRLQRPFTSVMDVSAGVGFPRWLPGARLNIVESCFTAASHSPAIIHQGENGPIKVMTVGELEALTYQVAAGLVQRGFKPGDALATILPMTAEAVAIYLGIIAAGCVVVGIPDSFRPKEIATRLRLANAVAVFTQDVLVRNGKELPLYANVVAADAPPAIVFVTEMTHQDTALQRIARAALRKDDCGWTDFLVARTRIAAVPRDPADHLTILFSSGTTGEPKAIPWTQTTPIKCAVDAHFHHDLHPGAVVAWPTNLGWMMGPWLIFASLINRGTMALYDGAPFRLEFGKFIQDSNVTMLGVVPSLVKTWREAGSLDQCDWRTIKLFSSTGECSNADDMRWLMRQAGGRPVIEYCGGTEVGGGYITGTVTRPCIPATFNTAALGLDFEILDENTAPATIGEAFLVPPSIGLSNELLGQDHHAIYYADAPRGLRRHGDQIERLANGYFRAHGRVDDTMNLGGIKVSSAEIERAVAMVPGIQESAAIAIAAAGGGPSQLVIYVVRAAGNAADKDALRGAMQQVIKRDLNPLFKVHDVVLVDALPRTASNKVMRRTLRDRYVAGGCR